MESQQFLLGSSSRHRTVHTESNDDEAAALFSEIDRLSLMKMDSIFQP